MKNGIKNDEGKNRLDLIPAATNLLFLIFFEKK